jgi:hypothetical protein
MPIAAMLKDGLYRVLMPYLCAGFIVSAGKITRCAPILRRRIAYWRTIAQWICP